MAFAVGGVLGVVLTRTPIDGAVIGVHLAIAAVCFAVLATFVRPRKRDGGKENLP